MSDPADQPLKFLDALRFFWHCTIHPSHADQVFYSVTWHCVCCGECGRTWR